MISKDDVKHVAKLSKLKFNDEEIEDFTEKFKSVVEYIDKLKEVDTEGVEPTYHVLPIKNVMREDEVHESLSRDKVLSNATNSENGYIKIPKVLK
ncbi:Asp-tRNA(Asn)/Glu-tRNA(Gln) amidotransferase subunit GatC [Dethiothermospora halolimnae]|uniref:Asp-tRNA(Asn)/Glu-tRNA(Gln) amidotransferase subunit GatC n=1 Tax=Dethiothermospora halolimnae TaxID=3114390 RepID=UPI003CCC05F3